MNIFYKKFKKKKKKVDTYPTKGILRFIKYKIRFNRKRRTDWSWSCEGMGKVGCEGGHRLYDESVFERLSKISELKKTKTLSEIKKILRTSK